MMQIRKPNLINPNLRCCYAHVATWLRHICPCRDVITTHITLNS